MPAPFTARGALAVLVPVELIVRHRAHLMSRDITSQHNILHELSRFNQQQKWNREMNAKGLNVHLLAPGVTPSIHRTQTEISHV
ncbi:MAG TPA: hypothetical protein VGF69_22065 [Thermoanaerobaculia bacterium]|jgi:hypothetical protein